MCLCTCFSGFHFQLICRNKICPVKFPLHETPPTSISVWVPACESHTHTHTPPSHHLSSLLPLSPLTSNSAVPIARINYPSTHIVENILQGMRGVINKIPRGWRNVQAVHLKTTYSISLPVYNTLPPAPERLPAMDEGGPRRKRIKLEHVSSPGSKELIIHI